MPDLSYLASPYSSHDPAIRQQRFEAACRCAAGLMRRGVPVFSPIAHTHPIALAGDLPKGWEFWRDYDTAILKCCKEFLILPLFGWRESVGLAAELEIAKELGLPISFIDEAGNILKSSP